MASSAKARHELRAERAAAFVRQFRTNNSGTGVSTNDNHLYTMIGRETYPKGFKLVDGTYPGSVALSGLYTDLDGQWGSGLYPSGVDDGSDDDNPPSADSSQQSEHRFWATAIAAKKVLPTNIHLLVPRINWETGGTYEIRDMESESWYEDTDFYVLNSVNEVWMVVAKEATATVSTIEPSLSESTIADTEYFRDGKDSIFVASEGDGDIVWKFMYKLTSYMVSDLLQDDWLPVPCAEDTFWPSGSQTALLERDRATDDAYLYLGARHVLVLSVLNAGADGSGLMPAGGGLDYRQVALVRNPVLVGTSTRATGSIYYQANSVNGANSVGPTVSVDELEPFVGEILYLENRSPIEREENQTEEFKTILVF